MSGLLCMLADEATTAAQVEGRQGGWPLMAFAVVTMLLVAALAWKLVQRQERGDAELEAKLKADDERAERGRRGEQ